MKKSVSIFAVLTCMVAVVHGQEVRTGTFKFVAGDVQLSRNGQSRAVAPGTGVVEKDRIVTGKEARATLTFKDGTVLAIGPDTSLDLPTTRFDTTTQDGGVAIHVLKGSLRLVTGWLGKLHPEKMKVTTPTSVVGLRGTDVIVEVP